MPGRILARLKCMPILWTALKPLRWTWWNVIVPAWRKTLVASLLITHSETVARRLSPDPLTAAMLANRTVLRWFNRQLCGWSFRLRLPVALGRPYEAIVEMSNRCTLHCPLCSTGGLRSAAPHLRRGEMAPEVFRKTLDRLLPWVEHILLYNWGEPFLNQSLCDCVAYATRKRVLTCVSTNMQLYTEELGRNLIAAGLSELVVSCDGLTQESYARYRTSGSLAKVVDGVSNLLELRTQQGAHFPVVTMQFIVFRHNEAEREAFERQWRAAGVDKVRFVHMSFMSREGRKRAEELDMIPRGPEWAPHFPYGRVKSCEDLYRHVTINWDGSVYPCCFPAVDEDYAVGNVTQECFGRIWNGPRYRYARRLVARQRCDARWYESMCHDCTGVFPAPEARRYWLDPPSDLTKEQRT